MHPHVTKLDCGINPHFKPMRAGAVAKKVILTDVAFRRGLEVEQRMQRSVRRSVVVLPFRMGVDQRLDDLTLDHHEPGAHALRTHKTHAVHQEVALFILVQMRVIRRLLFPRAANTTHDVSLGIRRPRK